MYSRGFVTSADVKIPEKYDGTALREISEDNDAPTQIQIPNFSDTPKREIKISPSESRESENDMDTETPSTSEGSIPTGSFFSTPLKWLSGLIPDGLKSINPISKIEFEELIIIGLAAFLFFSKSGDKECALMILALIFIT